MKNKIMIISSMIIVIGVLITTIIINNYQDYNVIESNHIIKDKSNLVGVVLLQESEGSSTYIEQTGENADVFPTTGYHINLEKSKCENGGSVSYDTTNKKVLIDTNITDKCYIYFDLGDAPSSGGGILPSAGNNYNFIIMLETSSNSGIYNPGTYAELQADEYFLNNERSYCSDSTLVDVKSDGKLVLPLPENSTTCYLYYDLSALIYEHIVSLATTNNHIIHHNGTVTARSLEIAESDSILDANDNSYRYAGGNGVVNDNYVCFGYNRNTITDTNGNNIPDDCEGGTFSAASEYAYRIIGAFNVQAKEGSETAFTTKNLVKLIKSIPYDNGATYYWSGSSSNTSPKYTNSTLFTNPLNSTYLSTLNNNGWTNFISQPIWNVGGCGDYCGYSATYSRPSSAYKDEMVDNGPTATNNNKKIGLMYVSDYGYSSNPVTWYSDRLGYYDTNFASDNVWMYMNNNQGEWTISCKYPNTENNNHSAYAINSNARPSYTSVYKNSLVIRPVFYLASSVIESGAGTINNPYLLSLPNE